MLGKYKDFYCWNGVNYLIEIIYWCYMNIWQYFQIFIYQLLFGNG